MQWKLTAVFQPMDDGFIARAQEFPDVVTRGETLDEARENLRSTIRRMIESSRAQAEQELAGSLFIEETMVITRESDGTDLRFTYPGT